MRLIDVDGHPAAVAVVWRLLIERPAYANICHRTMPTPEQHAAFVASKPYAAWYLIEAGPIVGSVYLTHNNEIGVFVLKAHQRMGYARQAIEALMTAQPRDHYLANIAPGNEASIRLFERMGFGLIGQTYELRNA